MQRREREKRVHNAKLHRGKVGQNGALQKNQFFSANLLEIFRIERLKLIEDLYDCVPDNWTGVANAGAEPNVDADPNGTYLLHVIDIFVIFFLIPHSKMLLPLKIFLNRPTLSVFDSIHRQL